MQYHPSVSETKDKLTHAKAGKDKTSSIIRQSKVHFFVRVGWEGISFYYRQMAPNSWFLPHF